MVGAKGQPQRLKPGIGEGGLLSSFGCFAMVDRGGQFALTYVRRPGRYVAHSLGTCATLKCEPLQYLVALEILPALEARGRPASIWRFFGGAASPLVSQPRSLMIYKFLALPSLGLLYSPVLF